MSAATDTHTEHEHAGAEPDNPKVLIIGPAAVISILFVVALIAGVFQFYSFAEREQINAVELSPQNSKLRELRASEKLQLNEYRYVDKSKGVVRIPLDRAVALTLHDWGNRPVGTKPVAVTPAPAPAPGTAPAPGAVPAVAPAPAAPAAAPAGQK